MFDSWSVFGLFLVPMFMSAALLDWLDCCWLPDVGMLYLVEVILTASSSVLLVLLEFLKRWRICRCSNLYWYCVADVHEFCSPGLAVLLLVVTCWDVAN